MNLTIMSMRFGLDRHEGAEEHLWQFATRAAQTVPVQVLTENTEDQSATESPLPNLEIFRYKNNAPIIWRWPYLVQMRMWIKQLKTHSPKGWIWTVDPTATMAAILCGYGNRVIYNPANCFGTMHRVWENQPHINTLKITGSIRWLDQLAYQRAAKVVVASQSLGKQYTLCYGSRKNVHIIPYGIDCEAIKELPEKTNARKALNIAPGANVIGYVGQLDPCKDIPHLVNACSFPGVLRPQDRVLIVGDGPDKMRIQGCIRANGLSDRIILTGFLKGEALSQAYAAMDVFVLPSIYETYGKVIFEAMAAGLPVIGRPGDWKTSFTSIPEMIHPHETGLIMHEHDPEDLSEKLLWMAQYPKRRRDMGKRAQASMANHSWDIVVQSYMALLQNDDEQTDISDAA